MTKTKILIIEDEGIVAMDLQTRLQNLGYIITGSESTGRGGLASINRNRPDLILLDIIIDGKIDGIETAHLIRQRFSIPVIYLTSHSDSSTFNKAKLSDPYGYILKPFAEKDLQTTIEIALHKNKTEMELIKSKKALKVANELLEEKVAERTKKLSTLNRQLLDEISLHKRTAIELKESEARYRGLFENSMDAIITINSKGEIDLFNPRAEKLFGFKHAEIRGKNINMLMSNEHRDRHNGYIRNYEKTGENRIIDIGRELEARTKEGEIFQIELKVHKAEIVGDKFYIGFIRDITETKRVELELHNERQKGLSAIIDGQELERKRVARELHDGIGQMLLGIKLNVGRVNERIGELSGDKENCAEVIGIINSTMAEVKRISQNLSPSILEDFGLKPALRKMASVLSDNSGVLVRFSARGVHDRFSRELETGIYRIAQESTNNAIRHGNATTINISLRKVKRCYRLMVKDNGKSFDDRKLDKSRGHGIYNMYERAALLDGELEIDSIKERGTNVIFDFCKTKI